MKQFSKNITSKVFAALLIGSALSLSACGTIIDQHGYVAQEGAVADITVGMPKSEVISILGSPSVTTSSQGLSYYYISSKQDRFSLLGRKENDRSVVAVHFSRNRVKKIAHYGLQDGVVIDFISQTTPTYKKDLNFLQQLFGGLGTSNPNETNKGGFADDASGEGFEI